MVLVGLNNITSKLNCRCTGRWSSHCGGVIADCDSEVGSFGVSLSRVMNLISRVSLVNDSSYEYCLTKTSLVKYLVNLSMAKIVSQLEYDIHD